MNEFDEKIRHANNEDDNVEWWKPTQQDNFNLTKKLIRIGCRPLQRKYLTCIRSEDQIFDDCQVI